jgi:chromosome condensin MukBEF complex kleisin-like MukF subunit
MKAKASTLIPRMLSDFCAKRLAPVLPEEVVKRLHQYMGELPAQLEYPSYCGAGVDLTALAETLSLDISILN